MKYSLVLIIFIISFSLSQLSVAGYRNITDRVKKCEISAIDSNKYFYIFKIKKRLGHNDIIIAEKEKISQCMPFKRFIIADSVYQTAKIKVGNGYVRLGDAKLVVNGVRITNIAGIASMVRNCDSFTD